ncbi:hypothetical protein, partial [Micromonospora aurantiaca (nom. illeg.)]|uniref:hypothetical protein n=1 Tax=Micromonospora aurantiaca (nom. illeg.) TaxID=47850 RepID=UPI0037B9B153
PDGTKTLRVYDGPAFIRDGAGAWKPIDNRLSRRADGRYAPASAADVSIASRSNDPRVATLFRPGLDGDIETWRNTGDACTKEVP